MDRTGVIIIKLAGGSAIGHFLLLMIIPAADKDVIAGGFVVSHPIFSL